MTTRALPATRATRRWRLLRRFSTALIVVGLAVLAYVPVILIWGDPFTRIYTHFQQERLARDLSAEIRHYAGAPAHATPGGDRLGPLRADAATFARSLHEGQAFGRISIPRIGISFVVVQGTSHGDLENGPGHYLATAVPGLGRTVAIAGHRTTYAAPFRHIDGIHDGDRITLEMPYATFTYRVQHHTVVDSHDWSIIRNEGYDRLVLSACHPLFFATHRWVVFARVVSARLRTGQTVRFAA